MKRAKPPNTYRLETEEHDGKKYPTLVAWLRKPSPEDIARFCRENPGVMHAARQLDKTACVFKAELAPPVPCLRSPPSARCTQEHGHAGPCTPLPPLTHGPLPPGKYVVEVRGTKVVGKRRPVMTQTVQLPNGQTTTMSARAEPVSFDHRVHVSLTAAQYAALERRAKSTGVALSTMARILLTEVLF